MEDQGGTILHNKGDHIVQYIRDLYCSKEDSDLTLVCDDAVTAKAHKFLLAIHSSVVRSVLQDDNESPVCVSLPGTKFEDLDMLLNLIYLRKSPGQDYGNNKCLLELMKTLGIEISREAVVKQELVEQEQEYDEMNSAENLEELGLDEKDSEQSETDQSDLTMPMEDIFDMFVVKDSNSSPKKEVENKGKTKQHKMMREQCNVCKKRFRNEMMLKIHMEEHQEEIIVGQNGRLCCNRCDKTFKTIYQLRDHKLIHVQGMFSCDRCPSKYSTYHALKLHLKHHDEVVECDQCDKKYRTKFILNEHKLSAHQGLRLKCNFCERGFTGSSNLAKHIRADHIGKR